MTYQMLLNSGLLDMKQLCLIPNGIDLSRFRSLPARDDLGLRYSLPIGGSIGISVGALRLEKNHIMFIYAAAQVIGQIPDSLFFICGDGPERAKLDRKILDLDLSDRIHLLGNRDDIRELLALSDIYTSSSREESFGLAVVEAMATGLPVVATSVGAVPEVVGECIAAILVPSGDIKKVAEAIIRIMNDSSRTASMAAAACAHARAFDIKITAKSYQNLYLETMGCTL